MSNLAPFAAIYMRELFNNSKIQVFEILTHAKPKSD